MSKKLEKKPKLSAILKGITKEPFKFVLIIRFTPIVQGILNSLLAVRFHPMNTL